MAIEINARKREAQGTGASRRLRRLGKVPGILYGGEQGPINIELDHQQLYLNLRNERFHASILTLDLAGTKEQVLLRALNMHPFKPQVQHIDLQRVSKDKKIHMKVPLHFVNAEKSPGVKEQGGVVNHVMNELDIVCFPAGPEGAHQIENRSAETARVLLFSGAQVPAVSVYPDSDAIGVGPDDDTEFYFKRGSALSRGDALD